MMIRSCKNHRTTHAYELLITRCPAEENTTRTCVLLVKHQLYECNFYFHSYSQMYMNVKSCKCNTTQEILFIFTIAISFLTAQMFAFLAVVHLAGKIINITNIYGGLQVVFLLFKLIV